MIPVLKISSDNLPEAFEKAVIAVWYRGIDIKTKYEARVYLLSIRLEDYTLYKLEGEKI